jgi:hypothetical protein
MQKAISSYEEKLKASEVSPYLIFRLVTTDDLLKIECDYARQIGQPLSSRPDGLNHYKKSDQMQVFGSRILEGT